MNLIHGLIYTVVGLSIVWKILSDEMRGRVPLACARNVFLVGLAPRSVQSELFRSRGSCSSQLYLDQRWLYGR